jgi:hypothetical protein
MPVCALERRYESQKYKKSGIFGVILHASMVLSLPRPRAQILCSVHQLKEFSNHSSVVKEI